MKYLALLLVLPGVAFAQNKLPNPKKGQEVCYARAYSQEHLKKNPKQKILGVAVTLVRHLDVDGIYSTITVIDKKQSLLSNGGSVLKADGSAEGKLPAVSVAAQMDDDGGRVLITQDKKDKNKIKAKVISSLRLDNESESLSLHEGSEDSEMILYRQIRSNGNAQGCYEILEEMVHDQHA